MSDMPHYIALIHKDVESGYGISFPDLPGVVTASDTLDGAIAEAAEALSFAAEDWRHLTGHAFPEPRSLDVLRGDQNFISDSRDAVVAAIPFSKGVSRAA